LEGSDSDYSSGSSCYSDYNCKRHVAKKGNKLAHKEDEAEKVTLADALHTLDLMASNNNQASHSNSPF
jgi:uncharacterized protein (UPF0147 family)